MEFNKLISPSLKSLFVKEMADKIISGHLKVGERLPSERELCERMGVSRAVINGGLAELARCGFVDVAQRKGVFVADFRNRGTMETLPYILEYNGGKFEPEMLESIYEVRICIERHIAQLAAKRRTPEDLSALRAQIVEIGAAPYPQAFGEAVHGFYHLLAIVSKNIVYPLNIQAYRSIYISLTATLCRSIPPSARAARLGELTALIEAGDGSRAADCIEQIALWGKDTLTCAYHPGESY